MKRRGFISLMISAVLLVSLCACGTQQKQLHELYQNEKIRTLNTDIPTSMDISIVNNNMPSYVFDVADPEYIQKVTDAFMEINVTENAKTEDFYGKYYIDFFWNEETAHIHMNDTIAEIIENDTVNYYRMENAENFLALINTEVSANNEAMQNSDGVVSEQNVEINVMRDVSFDKDGNCLLNIFVLNNNSNSVTVRMVDVKMNGKKVKDCPEFSLQGDTELGFQIPVKTSDEEDTEEISFHFEVSYLGDDFEPFIVSPEYTLNIG